MPSPMEHLRVSRLLRAADPLASGPQLSNTRHPLRTGGISLVVTAALFLGITEPGRAAVEWAAEQVGIVEVGDEPSLDSRSVGGSTGYSSKEGPTPADPDFRQQGPAVVIGSGSAPDGTPYEVTGYLAPQATCISFEWPTIPRSEPQCFADGLAAERLGPYGLSTADEAEPAPTSPVLHGTAGRDVSRIEAVMRDQDDGSEEVVQVELLPLTERLASRLDGRAYSLQAFLGFLPADPGSDSWEVELRAYGQGGDLVQTRTLDAPGPPMEPPIDEAEREQTGFAADLQRALDAARAGELKADVNQKAAARTLQQAVSVQEHPYELRGPEANQLEDDMIQLLGELRAAGDFPGVGKCYSCAPGPK